MFDIFQVRNNKLEITPEILTLQSFRDLYERDYDLSKRNAIAELLYVFHTISYRSAGVKKGYEGSTLHNYAVSNSGVKNEFKVDSFIKAAQECYKTHQYTPIDEELLILNRIVVIRNSALNILAETLKVKSKSLATDEKEFESFFSLSDKVSTFTNKIEKDFDIIQKLQDKLKIEENKISMIFGKKEYRESLDSDNELNEFENVD